MFRVVGKLPLVVREGSLILATAQSGRIYIFSLRRPFMEEMLFILFVGNFMDVVVDMIL